VLVKHAHPLDAGAIVLSPGISNLSDTADRLADDGVLAVRHFPVPEAHLRGIPGLEKNGLFMVLYV
jgi:hypothetical protein